ncbi:NHLP leader peptide family natural product precursor [Scytonema hofmannii PCC 7110]|uniref:NHLP leader peptide family natural product n=1 Tax=Scytonema hofmannii PCC 7110 TaxID=128403 RepID=A0A139XEF9_9CYAN|nr:NHLP leader peptide family RiPP precursor [Scytonema hofmannii]KYC43083.1 NHLP leader peptide family natural product precursor [Scytonema hofmannii PCC 7110]KYC43084.1 NHLP leader peptide family natural product precursor [Scytonema hofmannii PCC 7110]
MTGQQFSREEFNASIIAKTWQNASFRQELISNPRAVVARELGTTLPEELRIHVVQEDTKNIYLVIPPVPEVDEELSDEALEQVAGGYIASRKKNKFFVIA